MAQIYIHTHPWTWQLYDWIGPVQWGRFSEKLHSERKLAFIKVWASTRKCLAKQIWFWLYLSLAQTCDVLAKFIDLSKFFKFKENGYIWFFFNTPARGSNWRTSFQYGIDLTIKFGLFRWQTTHFQIVHIFLYPPGAALQTPAWFIHSLID